MDLVVMKFDGASLSDAAGLKLLADRVRNSFASPVKAGAKTKAKAVAKAQNSLVVVSALSGVTDSLFFAAGAAEQGDLGTAEKVCAELRERHLSIARQLGGEGLSSAEEEIKALVSALESRLQGVRLVVQNIRAGGINLFVHRLVRNLTDRFAPRDDKSAG